MRLTLLSALGGAGKTSLLSEWTRHTDEKVAWLTLDANDNDLGRFLRYIMTALQVVMPSTATPALTALNVLPPLSTESLLATLINYLSDASDPVALVLDDYQSITDQSIHDTLTFLIDHLPPTLRLILATREDPPLPLARLRARGQLVEIRTADLRFTLEEAEQFFLHGAGIELPAEAVAQLQSRAEGWAAGLQMVAVALQDQRDVSVFIAAFSSGGTHRHIEDYLLEEIFGRQPDTVQRFLSQTSILERFTEDLCAAVTEGSGNQVRLDSLYCANLFITALDEERRWYRYHQLFADFLRARLAQSDIDVPVLHQRASRWYAQAGLTEDAIRHALAAQDFEAAADLIERVANPMLHQSFELTQLRGWLQALPESFIYARPRLGAAYARLLFLTHSLFGLPDLETLETHLQSVERSLSETTSDAEAFSEIYMVRAEVVLRRGAEQRALELAGQALDYLPETNVSMRCVALQLQGYICSRLGHSKVAGEILSQAYQVSQQAGNVTISVYALMDLGDVRVRQGRLKEAEAVYRQAIQVGGAAYEAALVGAHLGLASVHLERNELEAAAKQVEEAQHAAEKFQVQGQFWLVHLARARLNAAQKDFTSALEDLHKAKVLTQRGNTRRIAAYRSLFALQAGNTKSAGKWADESDLSASGPISFVREFEARVLAQVWAAQGQSVQAAELAQRLLDAALAHERNGDAMETLVILAAIQLRQGKTDDAASKLERAFSLAEPGSHIRVFVEVDATLTKLLGDFATRGVHADHIQKIFAALRAETKPAPLESLVEALSERELEVLRLVAVGFSNPEIANQLVLSVATVKTHLNRLYGKLGARNRTEAVNRARELRLL